MTGLHYPDDLYADHEERKARRSQQPTGAYRSAEPVDPVTKPAHYQRAGIETIDYIRATLGDGFEAYCIGNVLKYVSRYREKGGIEDLRKAQVYLGWAIEPVKAEPKYPAAMREAKIAYDISCERIPKWSPGWINTPPNCDGLSARDVRAAHPMASEALKKADAVCTCPSGDGSLRWPCPSHPPEVIRDHDERLKGGEDRL